MKNPKDRNRLLIGWIVLILAAGSFSLYFLSAAKDGLSIGDWTFTLLPIVLIVVLGAIFFNKQKEVLRGGVLHDERSKRIMDASLARAYLLSIYWLLAMGFLSEDLGLEGFRASSITGLGILGMAVLFVVCYVYTSRFDSSFEG